jgi:hypothetical protein
MTCCRPFRGSAKGMDAVCLANEAPMRKLIDVTEPCCGLIHCAKVIAKSDLVATLRRSTGDLSGRRWGGARGRLVRAGRVCAGAR